MRPLIQLDNPNDGLEVSNIECEALLASGLIRKHQHVPEVYYLADGITDEVIFVFLGIPT